MAYEQKPNSGAIFKNPKKETEKHPNATGNALIACPHCEGQIEMWVSAWTKRDKNDQPWQSLAFTPKDKQAAPKQAQKGSGFDSMAEDIPFAPIGRGISGHAI